MSRISTPELAPRGIYQRGPVWWFRYTYSNRQRRVSLRTSDEAEAITRARDILHLAELDAPGQLASMRANESITPRVPRNKSRRNATFYILGCAEFIKIGVATDFARRLKDYKTHNPGEIRILRQVECTEGAAYRIERSLIDELTKHHHHGEWFLVPEPLLQSLLTRPML